MKKVMVSLFLTLLLFNCRVLNRSSNNKNTLNMEKFDINTFEKKETKLNVQYQEERNDSIIKTTEFNDVFQQEIGNKNNPYYTKKVYFKSNYQLKAESSYFYNVLIISKQFDEKGKLIKETNWEEFQKRKFSIEQLIEKLIKEFNIDLMDPKGKGVSCGGATPIYSIQLFRENSLTSREIRVDATTGEILSDKEVTPSEYDF